MQNNGPKTRFYTKVEEYRRANPGISLDAAMDAMKEAHPDLYASHRDEQHGFVYEHSASRGLPPQAYPVSHRTLSNEPDEVVKKFDLYVDLAKKTSPTLDTAGAIQKVAAEHPDLARARNIALSVPVIGGVVLADR